MNVFHTHSKTLILFFFTLFFLTIGQAFLLSACADETPVATSETNAVAESDELDLVGIGFALVSTLTILTLVFVYTARTAKKARLQKPVKKYSYRNFDGLNGFTVVPDVPVFVPRNHETKIVEAITPIDPSFNNDNFLSYAKEVFITLQKAWTERDPSAIRSFEKDYLFRRHEAQLLEYISLGRINVIDRLHIQKTYLHFYQRDEEFENLTVFMNTSMNDYIIDEKTRAVLKGDSYELCYRNFLLTFLRRTGVKTDPSLAGKQLTNCSNCGQPLSLNGKGACEHCHCVLTTGDKDWVLINLTCVKSDTDVDERGVVIY